MQNRKEEECFFMKENYYQILNISRSASLDEIKKAYRRLSKKYHPDSNPEREDAQERFHKISEAYTVLQDPKKRKEYDKELEQQEKTIFQEKNQTNRSFSDREKQPIHFRDMEEQFEKFFGFHPKTKAFSRDTQAKEPVKEKKNPLDMTEMFERYMGIKK